MGVGSGALEADKEHSCERKRGSLALLDYSPFGRPGCVTFVLYTHIRAL